MVDRDRSTEGRLLDRSIDVVDISAIDHGRRPFRERQSLVALSTVVFFLDLQVPEHSLLRTS